MKTYKVYVTRTSKVSNTFEVEADDAVQAQATAIDLSNKKYSHSPDEVITNEVTGINEPNIEDDLYWKVIEVRDWKKDHDYERIKRELSFYKDDFRESLKKFCNQKLNELGEKFDHEWLKSGSEGINVGEDGWHDLKSDVVGRGKDFYYSVTKEKLQKMADENDYEENFFYSFH